MNKTKEITLDESTVDSLLAINVRNRKLDNRRVRRYARQMKNGSFGWNSPQASRYIVNESFNWLMDGQTRLTAIKQSGAFGQTAFLDIVPDDEAEEVFKHIDAGRSRLAGQTISALGVKNSTMISGIAKTLLQNSAPDKMIGHAEPAEVVDFSMEKEAMISRLPLRHTHVVTRKPFSTPVFAGCLNAIRLGFMTLDEVCSFLLLALKDEGEEKSPSRQLSRFIVQSRPRKNRMGIVSDNGGERNALALYAFATKCCVAFANHRKVQSLTVTDADIAFARGGSKSAWEI